MGEEQILTAGEEADILIGFSKNGIKENIGELKVGGMLIVDSDEIEGKYEDYTEILKYFVPLTSIAAQNASPKAKNMVALGILAGFIPKIDLLNQLKKDITKRYEKKSAEVIESNIKALEAGYNYARTNILREIKYLKILICFHQGKN